VEYSGFPYFTIAWIGFLKLAVKLGDGTGSGANLYGRSVLPHLISLASFFVLIE